MNRLRRWVAVLLLVGSCSVALAQDEPLVVESEPLTPQEQVTRFRLPPGFEIQLVASEPDIQKPMNLAFDARGRLWVTHSRDYPYPIQPASAGNDGVTVLSDFGPDGRARSVKRFAEGMTIPIGLLPLSPDEALVFSVAKLELLRDTDGDGEADERSDVLTGFGASDTHGMVNGLRLSLDGWVYAAHGFSNESRIVSGTDGSRLELQSGNVFRFRPDGSRIERVTWGQVNPFGLTFDDWGFLYSADCHSMPVYQLIAGAHYPSFGKPHDGLGFGPMMIDHSHGSTGIAGIAFYDAEQFPEPFRRSIYIGNPITHRVHHDRVAWQGGSPRAETQEDLVICADGWFRPVDVRLGPDGALYIADFYNRIIGHYEVPLDHPGRDRERGRIWRVVYTGKGVSGAERALPAGPTDLTRLDDAGLVDALGSANLEVRTLATHEAVGRGGEGLIRLVREAAQVRTGADESAMRRSVHALHSLGRLGELDEQTLMRAAAGPAGVAVHTTRVLADEPRLSDPARARLGRLASHEDARVKRAAAEGMARHPERGQVSMLLTLLESADPRDDHLIHELKVALRQQLAENSIASALNTDPLALLPHRKVDLAGVALAVKSEPAAAFVFNALRDGAIGEKAAEGGTANVIEYLAENLPADRLDELVTLVRSRAGADPGKTFDELTSMQRALARRGMNPTAAMIAWAAEASQPLIRDRAAAGPDWHFIPYTGAAADPIGAAPVNPFALQERIVEGLPAPLPLISSHPRGERLTGLLRSRSFKLPPRLSLVIAGHRGFPASEPHRLNRVRLLVVDEQGRELEEVATAYPPRDDTARPVTFNLAERAGRLGVLEVIDGDTADAFAWLAIGLIRPNVFLGRPGETGPPESDEQTVAALGAARLADLKELAGEVAAIALRRAESPAVRAAAIDALASLDRPAAASIAGETLIDAGTPLWLRGKTAELLGAIATEPSQAALVAALTAAEGPLQRSIATALAATRPGGELLLDAVTRGVASGRLLQDPSIAARLNAAGVAEADRRIAELTTGLLPADERLAALIAQRTAAFTAARPASDPARGREVFTRSCAACHQFAGQGGQIGPGLDGVGLRGPARLIEDILDPSRNVDAAFRISMLSFDDGRVVTGLVRRTEGRTLILADSTGAEAQHPADRVTQRIDMAMSLMPPALGESLGETDLYDLLNFLLAGSAAP